MARRFNDTIDLAFNELTNVVLQNLAADPGAGLVDGRIWYDTVLPAVRVRVNGATVSLASGMDTEAVQDIVGAMTVGGTESGITVSYDDTNGRLDFTVTDSPLLGGQNLAYTLARANHTGTQAPATIQVSATDRILGRDTAAAGPAEELTVGGGIEFTGTGIQRSALTGDVTASAGSGSTAIASNAVTYAKMQDILTDTLIGRDTAATGDPESISVTGGIVFTGTGGIQTTAFTGDVTKTLGGTVLTIANSAVTNAKLANMAANSFKGNNTGGAAVALDLTVAQAKTLLAYVGTDVGFTPAQNIAATNVQAAIEEAVTDLTALIGTTIEARTWKDPVDAATTAALPALTYASGPGTLTATANAALAAQDGVTLAVGDDLLVKNQASTFQNGIYTVTQVGSGVAPFILTRRADSNTAVELRDATAMIEGGTTQKGDIYTQTASALADLTAAAQTWVQTGEGNTTYTSDGTTIELVGNSFRIATGAAGNGLSGGGGAALAVATGTGLEISADTVRIAAAAAGNGLTGGAGSALAVGAGTGIVVAATTVGVDRTTGAGRVPLMFAATLTGGATSEIITHSLGTRDVNVSIYNNTGAFAEEEFTVEHTSTTTVTIRSSIAIPAATYRVVVLG